MVKIFRLDFGNQFDEVIKVNVSNEISRERSYSKDSKKKRYSESNRISIERSRSDFDD